LNKLIKEKNIHNAGKKGIPFAVEEQKLIERGNWRTFMPVVDYKKCIKCGMCWLHCPDSAYTFNKKGFPECDGKVCKGCLLCITVCPVKAISAKQQRGLKEK
jgi:pyruvate ferredoxin oxidoreductase delta subunit